VSRGDAGSIPVSESFGTRVLRWRFNRFPAFRGTGGRITFIDRHFREVRLEIPLSRRTRNYVGTIFGGSMYGAADPIYMILLIKRLGRGYVVWDKAASIRFRAPGRSALYAHFRLDDEEVERIRALLETEPAVERVYTVELVDREGKVHATIEKTIHVRRREGSPDTAR
jgi:acyl-coenzyme A thioesterase PaaI-like protein